MATLHKEIHIDAAPEDVWDALAAWGLLHERLVPGYVTDTQLDDNGDRLVTFFNGRTVRERLVTCDPQARRLAWSIVGDPYDHHNAHTRVLSEPDGGALFVWTADLLPDELAAPTDPLMQRAMETTKRTLEAQAANGVSGQDPGEH